MEIHIDMAGDQEMIGLWARAPEIVEQEFARAMAETTGMLEPAVKEMTPVGASGGASGLADSITSEQSVGPEGAIGMVGTAYPYAIPVELGTKPHFPPVESLEDWVRVKWHLSEEKEVHSAAFVLARAISRRGTPGYGMFHRTFAGKAPEIEAIFAQARDRIVAQLGGAA